MEMRLFDEAVSILLPGDWFSPFVTGSGTCRLPCLVNNKSRVFDQQSTTFPSHCQSSWSSTTAALRSPLAQARIKQGLQVSIVKQVAESDKANKSASITLRPQRSKRTSSPCRDQWLPRKITYSVASAPSSARLYIFRRLPVQSSRALTSTTEPLIIGMVEPGSGPGITTADGRRRLGSKNSFLLVPPIVGRGSIFSGPRRLSELAVPGLVGILLPAFGSFVSLQPGDSACDFTASQGLMYMYI
ncbi:hypothetical protein J3F83DRAFT_727368 [Trichoderma novae-zelandiae]